MSEGRGVPSFGGGSWPAQGKRKPAPEWVRVKTLVQIARKGTIVLAIALFLPMISCAPTTQIVLLPDQDGKIGAVDVSTAQGVRTLDQPWEATEMSSRDTIPGAPKLLDEAKVKATYREALEAEPARPVHFAMYFRSDSTALTSASLKTLPQVLEAIRARHSTDIIVSGHTDAVGPADYNRKLSLRRARTVVDLLVSGGVNRAEIEMSYHGKENPLIQTPDGVPEPRNRRVEITVR